MGKFVKLFLIFLASAVVTLVVMGVRIDRLPSMRFGGGPQSLHARPVAPSAHAVEDARHASQLVASGLYREAQDEYLSVLHDNPADPEALRGLAAVRKQMAGGDATMLRRQAAAFRQAIASGADTPEHYTPASMEMLARACLQAAAAIEGRSVDSGLTQTATTSNAPPGTSSQNLPRASSAGPRAATGAKGGANPQEPASGRPAASQAPNGQKPPDQRSDGPSPAPADAQPATPQPQSVASTPTPPSMPLATPSPAGSENPPAAQPADQPPGSSETIAVLNPPSTPALTRSQGDLVRVDCQKRAFALRGANGDEEYVATAGVTIYVRGNQSERLQDFCGLQGFLGHTVVTWSAADGDRRIARWVSVILSAPRDGS